MTSAHAPMPSLPTVAIIGAGNVGTALARRFAAVEISVTLGVRRPEPVRAKFSSLNIRVETPRDAIVDADIVFLAVPGRVAVEAARDLADALAGKVLVDCNNPVGSNGGIVWDPPAQGSLLAAIQAALPDTEVVKGFNGFGAEFHENPQIDGTPVDVFLAGPDSAKAKVSALAGAAGFRPVDAGPSRNASLLENMAVLWIHLAMAGGQGRDFAFVMRRRPR